MEYNRNFFIAIGLSFAIMIGWEFFIIKPKLAEQQKVQQTVEKATNTPSHAIPSTAAVPQTSALTTSQSRKELIASTPRITINTPELSGSINLVGGQFDDLRLKKYHETVDQSSPEIALLNPNGTQSTYLAEFGFTGQDLPADQLPQYNTRWEVKGENTVLTPQAPVMLVYDNGRGQIFQRKIAVDEHYMFTITDSVTNTSTKPIELVSYARVARAAPPDHTNATYLLHEGMIGVAGNTLETEKYTELKKLDPNSTTGQKEIVFENNEGGFIGITDKYWAVAAIPPQTEQYTSRFVYFDTLNTHYQSDLRSKPYAIAPGQTTTITNRLFAGAKQVEVINAYQKSLGINKFELLIDWGWFNFITKPMFALIDGLYKFTGNFGVAILLVTVILKAVLFPLANKSYKSMARMRMLQPAITEIREKHKDDRVKLQQATAELYKREKINPLAGCWPLLVQFPIFFALYKVLYITIEMRHAPFFGWIHDLAAPDPTSIANLFGLLPYTPPAFLMIGAWPILMGITMFLQMRMQPAPADSTQAMIFTWMPIIFTYTMAAFPAGLVIYWAWNNSLSIIQQSIIMKRAGAKVELWDNLKGLFRKKPKEEASE
ncbi:membrane protein insertase YidC [Bartonella sp. DGB2]|uniref:membrane protein insertase YidC n=1 Tax=Bartonella sp. DGB2 TaxID=3388426 RepID=UPI00398FCAD8